ncbi:uncharacterized protein LOC131160858 [Malania oleifera]|uniref:uncharacterized protein LOC131160858 n=1 Tax=Malania oleifera TaxID=397392 RepID=UPI0025AE1C5F|nr:uncharacterized protein LOC131160858 [Malania oleifera]
MVTFFHDLMHKEIEVYVDDMIVKSRNGGDHAANLDKLFKWLRKCQLKLNPKKCTFNATSEKLLGFIVSEKGIKVDPDKVKAIQEMPNSKSKKEVRSFLGRLNYIARFISQLTATCEPIFKLLRNNNLEKWNEQCQVAFERIKEYLLNPPVIVPPVPGRPLILYLAVSENSMGCVLGQHDESRRKERAIYYLSKKFTNYKSKYSDLKKTCFALESHQGKCHCGIPGKESYQPMEFEFRDKDVDSITQEEEDPKKWVMLFDEAINVWGHGIGAILISPKGRHYLVVAKLVFPCTNNIAEYEACILGLQAAMDRGVKRLMVRGDSALVIHQLTKEWETQDAKLVLYQEYIQEMIKGFDSISFSHLPRENNVILDALATLATLFEVEEGVEIEPIQIIIQSEPTQCTVIEEVDGKPWFHDIKTYIQKMSTLKGQPIMIEIQSGGWPWDFSWMNQRQVNTGADSKRFLEIRPRLATDKHWSKLCDEFHLVHARCLHIRLVFKSMAKIRGWVAIYRRIEK